MIKYRDVPTTVPEVVEATCNKCGKVFTGPYAAGDLTEIAKQHGFGSPKDGDWYVSHVCEPCMDAIYASFSIPPQVTSSIFCEADEADKTDSVQPVSETTP